MAPTVAGYANADDRTNGRDVTATFDVSEALGSSPIVTLGPHVMNCLSVDLSYTCTWTLNAEATNGVKIVSISVTDPDGNIAENNSAFLIFDFLVPFITFAEVAPSDASVNTSVEVDLSFNEEIVGIPMIAESPNLPGPSILVNVPGPSTTSFKYTYTTPPSGADETYTLTASATDLAGNIATGLSVGNLRLNLNYTAPAVSNLSSPSDTLPPNGVLNAAEQTASGRVYELTFDTDEDGDAAVVVNGVERASAAVTVGSSTLTVTLDEGDNDVWVVVTDIVGNTSPVPPAAGGELFEVLVDTVAPTLAFVRPSSTPLNSMSNLDVRVASDEDGATVNLLDAGTEVATAVVAGGFADFPHATDAVLSDGSHTLTASVSDAAGNMVTAATSPETVDVDTTPPSGAITAPADGAVLTDINDASLDPGYQISVDFGTADGATGWTLWIAKGCTAAFEGCGAPVVRAAGSVTNPDGAEPMEIINVDIEAPTTYQKVILETVDAVGNMALSEIELTFNILA